ncbi:MAG: copper chaperone PCu(A)C [Panacagrimonas sp.]
MNTTRRLRGPVCLCRALPASLLALLLIAGCKHSGEQAALAVTDAYIRMPPPGVPMAAGYFRIRNPTDQTLKLRSISSPDFASTDMHETSIENGLSKMRLLQSVSVAPGAELIFEPGGRHLMLSDPATDLAGKARIPVGLTFERPDGSALTVEAFFDLSG